MVLKNADFLADLDISVIRTSIDIGHNMIDQILQGVHHGTEEVRSLLCVECDYILECKVCRNLFRSFANLVAHKRVYCKDTHEDSIEKGKVYTYPARKYEETFMVQPESPEEVPAGAVNSKDSAAERVKDKQVNGVSEDCRTYTKVDDNVEFKNIATVASTVTLTAIPSNPNAVIVSHSKRDYSGKPPRKSSPKKLNEKKQDPLTESHEQVAIDKVSAKPKSIDSICTKLASQKDGEIGHTGPAIHQTSPRAQRAKKVLPKKFTEDFVNFKLGKTGTRSSSNSGKTGTSSSLSLGKTGTSSSLNLGKAGPSSNLNLGKTSISPKISPVKDKKNMHNGNANKVMTPNSDWMKHCNLKNNMCKKCGALFVKQANLKVHLSKHGIWVGQFKCFKCRKYFILRKSLRNHIIVHHNIPKEEALKCIKEHMCHKVGQKCHKAGQKENKQNTCSQSSDKSDAKTDHMQPAKNVVASIKREPVGQKEVSVQASSNWMKYCDLDELSCNRCGACFQTVSCLKRHLTYHGIRVGEFKCPRCKRYFTKKNSVRRHLATSHNASGKAD